MSLTLDDIRYFTIVSETLNVTRASELIGISQPALSYSIKRLEKEFGADLIVRLKNGVQLTKTGQEFKKKAKYLIQQWEETQKILTGESSEVTGEFSIGVHPSVAKYSVDKIITSIYKVFPNLNFSLVHGLSREMVNKVVNWEIDFGIVINPIEHPDIVIKELGKDIVTLFKAKSSLKKLIYDPSLSQSMSLLKSLKKSKIDIDGQIQSGSLEVIAKLTSKGLGIGLLPTRVAASYPGLTPVKNAPQIKDKICLIYRKEKHKNEISRKILGIIREIEI